MVGRGRGGAGVGAEPGMGKGGETRTVPSKASMSASWASMKFGSVLLLFQARMKR
jgi:hypothetical protein